MKRNHLTTDERAAYWQRTLAPDALLEISDHLQVCAACREQLRRAKSEAKADKIGDVSYEEFVDWMEHRLDASARPELAERITRSPKASAELADLLRFRSELDELPPHDWSLAEPRSASFGGRWILPLAAGLALGFVFLWWT